MTRQATNKILEMVEEGILDKDTVIMSCLKYMSEDDVADMAHSNEFFINEEEDDDEPEMEDDPEGLVDIIPDYPEKEDE
jgi:hypothetical protein